MVQQTKPAGDYLRQWTIPEEEQLKKLYPYSSAEELTNIFGRSIDSVRHKGIRLGVRRYYSDFSSKLTRGEATEWEIGWITALFEGEGSVHFINGRKSPRPAIYISNTNREILEKAQGIIGGDIYICSHPEHSNRKTCYYLQLRSSRAVHDTLRLLMPNLIVKKRVSDLMVGFCRLRLSSFRQAPYSQEQKDIRDLVYKANKRGVEKIE